MCAMGDHQPSQRSAIRWGAGHGDKRLTFLQPLLVNVEDVPVVAPSLQPADYPRRETVFRSGWIKNVCTLLTVQNAYRLDVDVGSLQILDRGVDGLRVRQERCKLVDRSMAEFINISRRTLGHVFPSSGRCFENTLGRHKSHQNLGSTGQPGTTFTQWKSERSIDSKALTGREMITTYFTLVQNKRVRSACWRTAGRLTDPRGHIPR